jgi:hypothetical protein
MNKPVLNLPPYTQVQLIPFHGLTEGERIDGQFYIEKTGTFDFTISDYDVPESDLSGGTCIRIGLDGVELCCFHPKDVKLLCDSQEKYLMTAFLVALRGAEGKITGVAINDPVPFPLPEDLKCCSGMSS